MWLVFTDALPSILLRDAQLAAAVVMGPAALAASVGAVVVLVATLVHFGLSLLYGLALGGIIELAPRRAALTVGAAFGIALFAINMYGFTALFPWFAATRDPITAAAHVVFGISAAATYRAVRRP